MEKDYRNRTVLTIITSNDIKSFIVKSKLRFLLNKIWDGKDSNLIDGKIQHFSKMQYMLSYHPRSLEGAKINFREILNFKRNTTDYNFIF